MWDEDINFSISTLNMHIGFANFHVKLKPDGAEHNSKYF